MAQAFVTPQTRAKALSPNTSLEIGNNKAAAVHNQMSPLEDQDRLRKRDRFQRDM